MEDSWPLVNSDEVLKIKMKGELDCTIDLAIFRGTFKGYNYYTEYTLEVGNNTCS